MSDKNNYVLVNNDETESGVFTGTQPRQAALKVARAGKGTKENPETIRLRARGTKKLHIFKGYVAVVDAPEKRPAWMSAKIRKPFVEKIGTEKPKKEKKVTKGAK